MRDRSTDTNMSPAVVMERIADASPRLKARIAGAFYVLAVLTAGFGESFVRGWLNIAAGLIAVSCFIVVTLVLYDLLKPVNKSLALLATLFSLVGLTFEAVRLNPRGVDIALVFHGVSCLLISYLIFRSTFLPRILCALMAFAGLVWLTYLSPLLANYLSPYNAASGLLGEASPMLWLLVMGVNVEKWQERVSVAGSADESRRL